MSSGSGALKPRAAQCAQTEVSELPALFRDWLTLPDDFGGPGRDRLYPPRVTFWLFLSQVFSADGSCRETVRKFLVGLARTNGETASPDTSAYCQARPRLKTEELSSVNQQVSAAIEERGGATGLWHGRPVQVADGTTLSMPDTPENQAAYPQTPSQKPGLGFPLLRLVALFSLATGALLHYAQGPFRVHERTLFHRLWPHLKPNDLLLADCGFCSFADFYLLKRRGVDCVMRNHQARKKTKTVKVLGKNDRLVEWIKSYVRPAWLSPSQWRQLPKTLTVREIIVHVTIPGFRTKRLVIVTTLLDPIAFPAADFALLYRQRWLVELYLRHLKTTLGMEILSCKSPRLIQIELLLHLIAYNLLRALLLHAALSHHLHLAQLSFKGALDSLRQWAPAFFNLKPQPQLQLYRALLQYLARDLLPLRPNRVQPRAVKRRPKPFPLLTKPRHLFKEIPHRGKRRRAYLSAIRVRSLL